jgi:hypothetical protein
MKSSNLAINQSLILSNNNLSNCAIGSRFGGAITQADLACQASYGQKLQR